MRTELAELFAYGAYRPLVVTGPHREEIVAFARVRGADAVIVVAGRLFARASSNGRQWPANDAWDASLSVENFSELRDAIALETSHTGPQLAIKDLFAQIPVAVLRARHTPGKANRARRISGAAGNLTRIRESLSTLSRHLSPLCSRPNKGTARGPEAGRPCGVGADQPRTGSPRSADRRM